MNAAQRCCLALGVLFVPLGLAAAPAERPRHAEVYRPEKNAWEALDVPGKAQGVFDVAEISDGKFAFALRAMDAQQASAPRFCEVWDRGANAWKNGMFVVPTTREPPPGGTTDATHHVVDLHNGTALWVDASSAQYGITLQPAGTQLPPVDGSGAALLLGGAFEDGSIMLLGQDGAGRWARLWKSGATSWQTVPAPGELTSATVVTGPAQRAVLERPGAMELWDGQAWKVLPAMLEPRVGPSVVVARDGLVLAAGGMLLGPRKMDALGLAEMLRNALGALAVFVLLALAVRKVPPRRRLAAVMTAVVVGVALSVGGVWFIAQFAWH